MGYQSLILLIVVFPVADLALSKCSYDVCKNGGLWSEWTTNEEECPTACGSCSKKFYTRKCLSTSFGNCPCTGDSTRRILCNTKVCVYPAQRACCVPYVPMLINGTSQCGPIPKDKLQPSEAPCCPHSGMWSEWSGYTEDASGWKRTRKCMSEEAGCPCDNPTTSVEIRPTCPCKDFVNVDAITTKHNHAAFQMNVVYNHTVCTAHQVLHSRNNAPDNVVPCNRIVTWQEYYWSNLIRYVRPNEQDPAGYKERRMGDCTASAQKKVTFYCDMVSTYWRLDATNEEVVGFSQVNIV